MVRPEKVTALVSAASQGMTSVAKDTTADEVFSAYLSMARNAVLLATEMKRDNTDIRSALIGMLALCDTPGKVH